MKLFLSRKTYVGRRDAVNANRRHLRRTAQVLGPRAEVGPREMRRIYSGCPPAGPRGRDAGTKAARLAGMRSKQAKKPVGSTTNASDAVNETKLPPKPSTDEAVDHGG